MRKSASVAVQNSGKIHRKKKRVVVVLCRKNVQSCEAQRLFPAHELATSVCACSRILCASAIVCGFAVEQNIR
jgi:hypothetical protein